MIILEEYLEKTEVSIDLNTIPTESGSPSSLRYAQDISLFAVARPDNTYYLKFNYPLDSSKLWFVYLRLSRTQAKFLLGKVVSISSEIYFIKEVKSDKYYRSCYLLLDPL